MAPSIVSTFAAVLVLAGVAQAAPPPGFMDEPLLAARAAVIAGKPVSVYCAETEGAWEATAAQLAHAPEGVATTNVLAFVDAIGGTMIYLSPTACPPLLWHKPKVGVGLLHTQGAAIEILAHEAEHLTGEGSEGIAECKALAAMPTFAPLWIPAKLVTGPHRTKAQRALLAKRNKAARARMLRLFIEGARLTHQAAIESSPIYRGPCDPPPPP